MKSKIDSKVNEAYLKKEVEGLYFDRKSARIDSRDLANVVAAFANANGGLVAVGFGDDGEVEGCNLVGIAKLNELQKVSKTLLLPSPMCEVEVLKAKNYDGEWDKVILFHVAPSKDYVIRNMKGEVYYRQGDSCIKLNYQQVRSLEYERRERDFEAEFVRDATMNDIDMEAVAIYKQKIGATLEDKDVLKARGFVREEGGKEYITKAGLLLFGKNPSFFLPGARVRVVKFEGSEFGVGAGYNIVKDRTFDACLCKIAEQVKVFIDSQKTKK